MGCLGSHCFLQECVAFGTWRELEGLLAGLFCEGSEAIFERCRLLEMVASLHGAFSRLRVLAVGLADRARPDGSLGKPSDLARQHVIRSVASDYAHVAFFVPLDKELFGPAPGTGRPGIPADLFLLSLLLF